MYDGHRVVGIRPEAALLLCCARTCTESERAEQIKALLREDIDWVYLIRRARLHGVMPLLYWHLNAICPDAVPMAALNQLRDHFRNNTWRSLFLAGELVKLLNLLATNGIPAIPFKGPTLAASAYGNLALRQFVDLDILVRKVDVLRTRDLLVAMGWRPKLQLTRAQAEAYLKYDCEYNLDRGDGRVLLEIHWGIVPRYFSFPLDIEALWQRLEPISLGDMELPSLSSEDLLLILCVHGTKHLWQRLEWICDVAHLIDAFQAMDWGRVIEQSRTLRSERMVLLGLYLGGDLLGAGLPNEIVKRMHADAVATSLARQVREQLFRDTEVPPGDFKSSLFHLRARERLQDRLWYCFDFAITPTIKDWAVMPLPGPLFCFYYLVRPVRLAAKATLGQFRRICDDASQR